MKVHQLHVKVVQQRAEKNGNVDRRRD